ncbi:4Fe-4S dicluster domain-containing protein [Vibrio sp. HN007]|uniref:4Fe-4S dicluster domain-containing protein n=1 Tax=Vibrio iocasae TaxID=3098914 RepID=UPI0035D4F76D
MAHNTIKGNYEKLTERLNKFPQGVPPNETLFKILNVMFSEEEARLVSLLPIKPFTVETAAAAWGQDLDKTAEQLNTLASRALLLDLEDDQGSQTYVLPPPMAGFFEFSLMRTGGELDQKVLSELFHQYINVEDEFVTHLFGAGETSLGRAFVNESVLSEDNALHVLDYERASEVIKTASHIGVGMCYCRHKKEHIGEACDAPMDICMTFNNTARSLIKHGYARQIDEGECLDLLDEAYKHNLVQFGENIQNKVNFICNCCSCCCEALVAARRVGSTQAIHTTNFLPVIDFDNCNGCGKCIEVCPVDAVTLSSKHDHKHKRAKVALLDEDTCLGCGVCARVCTKDGISLKSREKRVITPIDSTHKAVLMAIERGTLQHLIFDNQAHLNHRVMAAILGVILKLPPIKQALASQQFKSKYLVSLLERYNKKSEVASTAH